MAVGSGWCVGRGVGLAVGFGVDLTVGLGVGGGVADGVGLGVGAGDRLGAALVGAALGDGSGYAGGMTTGTTSGDGDGVIVGAGWRAVHAPTAASPPTDPVVTTSTRTAMAAESRIATGRPPDQATRHASRSATTMAGALRRRVAADRAVSGAGVGSVSIAPMIDAARPARGATSVARANRSSSAAADRIRSASAGATGSVSQEFVRPPRVVIGWTPRRRGGRAAGAVPGGGGS